MKLVSRRQFLTITLGVVGTAILDGCMDSASVAPPTESIPPTRTALPAPATASVTEVPGVTAIHWPDPTETVTPELPPPAATATLPPLTATPTDAPPEATPTSTHPPASSPTDADVRATPTAMTAQPLISGYPARPSVQPGDTLRLHISTKAPSFRLVIYRQTTTLEQMAEFPGLPGQFQPVLHASEDFRWPVYPVSIPTDWPSGAYIAQCVPDVSAGGTSETSEILFVVLPAESGQHARILYKLALATYQAYNCTGDSLKEADPRRASLYVNPIRTTHPTGSKVSLHRPGGGLGGASCEPDDFYDRTSPRQTFAHWDVPMIRWLVTEGYRADYCTDLDLHENPALLNNYDLLLSVGHDEYWSAEQRNGVETFIERGGNVAFFSGNICWWRIQYVDNNTAIVCNKADNADNWFHTQPENTLTGVSYRNGGGKWFGTRTPLGYTVQYPDHWVYAGTGLQAGEVFGQQSTPPLIGYECDGARHTRTAQGIATPTGTDGTPMDFVILGTAYLDPDAVPAWDERVGQATATMGIYTHKGTVFTAATTDWPKVLATDPTVAIITRNVINRLSNRS